MKKTWKIDGMSCEHCAKKVELALKSIAEVKKVKVHLKKKETIIILDATVENQVLTSTIENLGYQVIEIL